MLIEGCGKHEMRRANGCEGPERCNDSNEASDVEEDDEDLEPWEKAGKDGVDEDADKYHHPCEQRALPLCGAVVGMIENDETLEDGASKDCLCCYSRDPSEL